jgi:PAS domain S-box-containing protein
MPYIRRILCIDDDPDALRVLTEYLALEGYEVLAAPDGASGIQMLAQEEVQLVITDLNMPGLTGMDVIEIVRKNYPRLQIMVVTGYGTIESVLDALHRGAVDYLVKPYLLEILKLSLGKAERQMEIEQHLRAVQEAGGALEGRNLLEALNTPVALFDAQLQPVSVNGRFQALFGPWGVDGPEGLPAKQRRRILEFLQAGGGEESLLLRVKRAGGPERVLELGLSPVSVAGQILLQASEVELREESESGLEEALLVVSPSGALLWANGVATDWFELGDGDLPSLADLLGNATKPAPLALLNDSLPATASWTWRCQLSDHPTAPAEVELQATPLLDEQLRRRGTVLCLRPIGGFADGAPWDRRHQAEECLPLVKLGEQGQIRWVSAGFTRLTGLPGEAMLQRPMEEALATCPTQLEEMSRVGQRDGVLVQLRPIDPGPVALDIEEQKAKLFRATSFLTHLLRDGDLDEHARVRERLEEVAQTLVRSGYFRRAALYLRDGETILGWGFAGYEAAAEEEIRQSTQWRRECEAVENCRLRIGTACMVVPDLPEGMELLRWEAGAFLTLPILDRMQREVGRLRLDDSISGTLPNEAQVHIVELLLRHVALSLDELELERQVARSEARYQDLYENAKYSIFVVDAENARIVDVNREAEKLTGFERGELIGRRIWETHSSEYQEVARRNWLRTLQREATSYENVPLQRKDGSTIFVDYNCMFTEFNGRPVVQSFYRDVTEKQALEFSLIQSQKLAGLGQLSAGVAHELRNPLGIINSSLYYISSVIEREDLRLPDQVKKHMGIIKNEVDRSRKIIENLLNFARTSSHERERVDLADLLRVTLDLMKKELLVNNIRLVMEMEDLPTVHLNLDELKQAFLNIILNATQAMPGGGMLRIRGRREGGRVQISFEDTGQGISQENLPNVLNPFFTTKEPGTGTGLGLSLTHSFIRRAGGDLTLESELGIGTTVRIYLPAGAVEETP